jgi:Pyruvate/2-oxoacid:ferredoxin oxidoreductase delta subunit
MDELEKDMEMPSADILGPGSIIHTGPAKPKQPRELLTKDPWMHRSERMRCDSCMFYVPKQAISPSKLGMTVGRCRRRAPAMNGYPVVFANDWCGDHKLDENHA